MVSRFARAALLAVIPVFFLAACGGGGGDDGGTGGSGGSSVSPLVISSGNAQAVAAEALQTSTSFDSAAFGASMVTGVQVDGSSAAGADTVRIASAARKLFSLAPAGSMATGVTVSDTITCTGGGTLTFTETSSGGTSAVAGDSVTFTANNCVESLDGYSTRMNGSMTITLVSGSYDAASTVYPKSFTMRIVSNNFTMTIGTDSSVSNGDLTVALTENSADSFSMTLSATSLSNTVTTAGGSHSVTLKNYSHKLDASSTGATVQLTATVETNNGRIGSGTFSYTVETVTPFTQNASGQFTAGSLKVTGSGSSLLLTVTATDTFELKVDANGDGTYETATTVTRVQLESSI